MVIFWVERVVIRKNLRIFLGEVKKCQKMDQKRVKMSENGPKRVEMSENLLGLKFCILVNIHHGNFLTFLRMGQFSDIFSLPKQKI